MTLERDGLKEELAQKSRVVTDLSLRVQALTDQMNGNGKHLPSVAAGLAVAGVKRRIHEVDQLVAATALRRTR